MIGDVLLITEKHTRAASQLKEIIKQRKAEKPVVAIAGESGSGKSEVAHELRRLLKKDGYLVKILHGDNYYKTSPTERTAWRKKHGIESIGENEYDWELLKGNIEDFQKGRESVLPFLDLFTNQRDRLITDFKDINVLILEGLYCLRAPADLKVLIDLTYHETKKAQIVRGKETLDEYRLQVLEREHQVIQSHRSLANFLITRDYNVIEQGLS